MIAVNRALKVAFHHWLSALFFAFCSIRAGVGQPDYENVCIYIFPTLGVYVPATLGVYYLPGDAL
jgi:hypothetical protein